MPTYLLALAAHTCVLRFQREDVDDPGVKNKYSMHVATGALLGGHGVDHRCCIPKRSVLRGMKPGPKHELAIERTPFYLTGAGWGVQEMVRKRRI